MGCHRRGLVTKKASMRGTLSCHWQQQGAAVAPLLLHVRTSDPEGDDALESFPCTWLRHWWHPLSVVFPQSISVLNLEPVPVTVHVVHHTP